MDEQETPSICIIKTKGGIGDFLSVLPSITALRKKFQKSQIDWLIPDPYIGLFEHVCPDINIIGQDHKQRAENEIEKLASEYDHCFRFDGMENQICGKSRNEAFMEHYDLEGSPKPEWIPRPQSIMKMEKWLIEHDITRPFCLFAPKSRNGSRSVPSHLITQIIEQIPIPIVTINHYNIIEAPGLLRFHASDLVDIGSLIYLAQNVITCDTSILHFAGTFGKRMLAVFAHSNGSDVMRPYEGKYVQYSEPYESADINPILEIMKEYVFPEYQPGFNK